MITSPSWSGKRYAVLGLARSGKATAEALLASGASVVAWDSDPEKRDAILPRPGEGDLTFADPLTLDLTGFAGVVVSPGVPLNTHPIAGHAAKYAVPVIGDIELFAQARRSLPPHKVVGITGTNGKSTTTALTHHILKTAGVPTTMGGNIGLPILEQDPLTPNDRGVGVYVLELSSYQIDLTYSLDCDVAVLLNVTPDHLDRYESFEDYAASKARLFAMQSADHAVVVNPEDAQTRKAGSYLTAQGREVTWKIVPEALGDWPSLRGYHNRLNASAAVAAAILLGVDDEVCWKALQSFQGLPHRMERVAEIGGVAWVNDSKGTNTAATAPALAAFENIHWIVGGLAKEPGLGECEAELGHVKAAYTIGKSGEDFARLLEKRVPTTRSGTLQRAVEQAALNARSGDTVLLSPACASFDQFRDFEHRGEAFRDAVLKLQGAAV